jgi:hypothetical protein
MEREPPQARDIRMAGVRPVRDRGRHGRRSEDDRPAEQRRRPGEPRRSHPQAGRLHRVRPVDRVRRDPEPQAHDSRPRLPNSDSRRHECGVAVRRPVPQSPIATRAREPRPGHTRRAHRTRRVGHERHGEVRREPDRSADQRSRVGGEVEPEVLRRRGRGGQLRQSAQQDVQPAGRSGRNPVGTAGCWRPSCR